MRTNGLRAVLFGALALFSTTLVAQETTLKVGVRGASPGGPPVTHDLSTAQVDGILNAVLPSRFGAHYTRDKANAVFANLEGMRVQLNSRLATALNQIPDVSITSVNAATNALSVSIGQTPSAIRVALTGVSIDVRLQYTKYDIPLLCENVSGRFNVSFVVGGDYDIPSGTLVNPRLEYGLNDIHTECNGLLGRVGDRIRAVFGYGTGYARDILLNELRNASNTFVQLANARTIFSISDFLDGLRNFSNYSIVNEYANEAIDAGQQIIANPSSLYRAFKLTISVSYGPGGNVVSFIASHAEETPVYEIQYSPNAGFTVFVQIPPGTSQATLYQRSPNDTVWYPFATLPFGTDSYFVAGSVPVGSEIRAIGRNLWHSRLYAEGDTASVIVNQTPVCTHLPCSPIEPEL